MPPYFFLSYAKADDGRAVQRFFRDLSDSIRVREKLPDTEIVGCSGVEHFENRDEGLRTSRVMVALVSPNYLTDDAVEDDWRAFEQRKARITRVNWLRHHEPLPKVLASAPVFPPEVNGNRYAPLAVMIAAIGKYKTQYDEFVNTLADYIIDSAPSTTSKNPEEPDMKSQLTNPFPDQKPDRFINNNVNQIIIDGAFVKSLAERMKETTPGSMDDSSSVKKEVVQSAHVDERYSVVVVDQDTNLLQRIEALCGYSDSPFDCKTYDEAEDFLHEVETAWLEKLSAPDLFLVNLELTAEKLQSERLIEKLAHKWEIPSAIIAISDKLKGSMLLNAASLNGAVTGMIKTDIENNLLTKIAHWAEIGRKRRLRRTSVVFVDDETRSERPIFLSYSSVNNRAARIITNSFEDWKIDIFYAGYSIGGGDSPPLKVRAGLKKARIFVPLISENFVQSPFCKAELENALKYKDDQTRDPPLTIIPILYDYSSEAAKKHRLIARCLDDNREIIMRSNEPVDGFQELLKSVRQFLRR